MNYLSAVDFCFLDKPGGSGRVAWDIARIARDRGWQVSMLSLNPDPNEIPSGLSSCEDISLVRYSKKNVGAYNPFRMSMQIKSARDAFNRWLGGTKWDLVHIHSPFTGAGVMRALGQRATYVYTVHSPVVSEVGIVWKYQGLPGKIKLSLGVPLLRRLEKRMLLRSSAIHVLSDYTRKEMQRIHGITERVSVIPHWPPLTATALRPKKEARKALGWHDEDGSMVFFTVRQHRERYGIDVAIRALAGLSKAHRWTFYVGGDGPLRHYLEDLALSLGIGDRVVFTGRLSDEALSLAYQAADLFILPTVALECFGLITLESLSFGCPVVATDAAAIPETLRPITPDLIVPAGNVDALRDKLRAILEGKISLPSPPELRAYVDSGYRQSAVSQRLFDLLQSARQRMPAKAGGLI